MSAGEADASADTSGLEVEDAEDYVDKQIKKRVLESRARVNEREDELFNGPLLDPELNVSQTQCLVAWGNTVRQFLRDIEVLLQRLSQKDKKTKYYYSQMGLGEVRLVPTDTEGYPFSKVAYDGYSDHALRRELGISATADLPEPRTVTFNGLVSIIEQEAYVSEQWSVCVDDSGPPPEHEYVATQTTQPIPKHVYENAVRAADRFLHDAGIGLSLRDPGEDTIRSFDQSGDEPEAEYSKEAYSGDPDL